MNTIRNGKIARLPAEVREQVNRRLADHESGTSLLAWLNALPEVRAVLAQEFGGKAVNGYNLHEWKHGGWAEWRRNLEAREIVKNIDTDAAEAGRVVEGNGESVTGVVATWLAARYAVGMKSAVDAGAAWEQMREFCHDMVAMQRADHRTRRLEFERVRAATHAATHAVEAPMNEECTGVRPPNAE